MVLEYSMLLVYITAVMSNPCHNKQLSTVPHPHNCNTFIVCWMSQLYFQACPTGSLFDTLTNNCQPWPIAQCCNGENPNSRRPLPSSNSVGKLVTRILSTEKNTLSTKLLPDDVTNLVTSEASEQTSDSSVESTTAEITSTTDINSKVTEPKAATGTLATTSTSRTTIGASEIPTINDHTLTSAAIETTKHNLPPALNTTPTKEPCWICSTETEEESTETTTAKKDSKATHVLSTKTPSAVTEYYTFTTKRPLTPTHRSTENEVVKTKTSRKPFRTLPPVTPTLVTIEASEQTSDSSVESTTAEITSTTDNNSKVTEPKAATGTLATTSTSRTTIGASEIPTINDHTLTSAAIETTKHNLPPALNTTPTKEPCWICSTETEEESTETTTAKKDSKATHVLSTKTPSAVTEYYTFTTKRPLTPTHRSTENELVKTKTSRKPFRTLPPVAPTLVTIEASEQTSDFSVESTTAEITSTTDINSKVTEPKAATGTLATTSTSRTTNGASEIRTINDHTLTSAAIETTKHNLPPALNTTPTKEPCWICSTETEEESTETTTAKKDSKATQILSTKTPSAVTEYYTLTTKRPLTPTHRSTENEVIKTNTSRKPIRTLPPVTPTLVTIEASEQTSDSSVESTTAEITSTTDINSKVTEPKAATGTLATTSTSRTTIGASEIPTINDHTLTFAAIETTKHNLPPALNTTPTKEPCWICSTETEEESTETTTAKKDSKATHVLSTKTPSAVTEYYTFTTKRPLTPTHRSTENEVVKTKTSRKPFRTLPPVTPTLVTIEASEQTSDSSVESTTAEITSTTDNNSKVTEPKAATGTLATTSTSRTTIGASEIPTINDHTLTSAAIETTKHNLPPALNTTPTKEPCWICSTETEEESTETTTAKKDSKATHVLSTKTPSAVTEYYTFTTKRPLTPTHRSTENELVKTKTSRKPFRTLPPVAPTLVTIEASEQTSDFSVESTTAEITSTTDINSKVTEPKAATGTLATTSTSRTTNGASEIRTINDHTLTSAAIETTKHNLPPALNTTPTKEPCWICSTETEEESTETTTAKKDSKATQILSTKTPSAVTEYYTLTTKRPLTPTHRSTENEVIKTNTSRKPIRTLPPVTPTLVTIEASEQTSDSSVESTTAEITSTTDINSKVTEPKAATGTLATTSTSRTTIGASEIPTINDHTLTFAAIETTKHNLPPALNTTPTKEPCWICSTETEEESTETTTAKKDSKATHVLSTKTPSAVTEYYTFTTKRPLTPTHRSTENEVVKTKTSRKPFRTLPPVTPTLVTIEASEQTSDSSVESTTAEITSTTDINSKVTEPKAATGTLATTSTSRTTIGASEIPTINDQTLTSAAIETTKHNLPPALNTTPTKEPCWICSTETEEESTETTTAKKDSKATHVLSTKTPSAVTEYYTFTTKRPLTPTHRSTENEVIKTNTSRKPIRTLPPVTPTLVTIEASEQTSDSSVESTTAEITSTTDINSKVTEPKAATGTLATTSISRTTIGASEIPTINDHTLTSAAIETTKHNLPPALNTTPTKEPCWICSTETEEESTETTTAKKDSKATHVLSTKTPSAVTEYYTFTTKRPLTPTHRSTENEVIKTNTSRKPIRTLPPVTPTLVTIEASEQTSDSSVESTTAEITSTTDINSKVTEPKAATGTLATTSISRTTIGASEIPTINDHTLTSAAIETTKHNLPPALNTTPTKEPCWICSTETEEESTETTTAKKDSKATQILSTKTPSAVTEYYTFTTKRPLTPTHRSTENEVIKTNTSRKPIRTLPPVTPTLVTIEASEQTSDSSVESTTAEITSTTDINSKVTEPKAATGTLATTSTSRTTIGASEIPTINDHTLTSAAIETTKHNLPPALNTTPTKEPCWICSTETEEESTETTTAKKVSKATHVLSTKTPSAVTEYYTFTTKRPLTPTHRSTENEVVKTKTSRKPFRTLPPVAPTLITIEASEQTSDSSVESTTAEITSTTDINSRVTKPKAATGTLATTSTSRTTIGASEIPTINDHTLTSAAIETTKHNLPPALNTTPTKEPCWICSTETEEESTETTTAKKDSKATHVLSTKTPSAVTEYYTFTTKRPLTSTHRSTENEVIKTNTSRKPIRTLPPVTPTLVTIEASEQTSDSSVESTTAEITSTTDINSKVTEPKAATGTLATTSTSRTTIGASEKPTINDHTLTSAAIETTKHNLPPALNTTPTKEPCWICSTETEEESTETTTAKKDSKATQILSTKTPSAVTEYYTLTTKRPLTPTHRSTENEVIKTNTSRKPIRTLPPVTPTLVTIEASEQTSDSSVESTTAEITSTTDINSKVTEPKAATGTLATTSTSRTTIGASEIPTINDHTLTFAAIETTKHNLPPALNTTPTKEPCWICSTETEEESTETTTAKKDSKATHVLSTKTPSAVTEYYTFTTKRPLTPTHRSTENEVVKTKTSRKPFRTLPPVTPTLVTIEASEQTSDSSVESTTAEITSTTDINSKVTEPKAATGTLATTSISRTTIGASEIPTINDQTLTSAAIETTKHNLPPALNTTPTKEPCWICSTETEEESTETTTAKKDSKATHVLSTKTPSAVTEYYTLTTKRPLTPTHRSTENEVIKTNTSRKPIRTLPPVTPTLVTIEASEQTSDSSVESTTAEITSTTDINSKVTEPKAATGTLATTSTSRTTIGASEIPTINDHTLTFAAIETTKHNLPPALNTTPTKEPCWICSTETEEESTETTTAKKDSKATHVLSTKTPSAVTEYYTFTTKRPLTPTHRSTENEVIKTNTSRKPNLTASTESTGTIEIDTSGTDRYPIIDLNTPTEISTSSTFKVLISKKPSSSVSDAIISQTTKTDNLSTNRLLQPTTSIAITDSSQSTGIREQDKDTLSTRPTLLPTPSKTEPPCPYFQQNTSTTSESPTKLQLPDCLSNDKYLYPDLLNCNFYFKCLNGVMQRMNCKPNFGFNPHLMKCVPEDSAKCGEYKSTADQKLYLVTFMLFRNIVENKQIELNKDEVENYLR